MAAPGRLRAQENAYDVLGKALMPIANVFASGSDGEPVPRAMVLDAHLISASKLPPQLQGQAAHMALRTPDALLVQAPIWGQVLTVCRDGDTLWAAPGSEIQALLGQLAPHAPGKKSKKQKSAEAKVFAPLALPVPQRDLFLLPALFQVADAGEELLNGKQCRVLDVQLMPELARSLHATDWIARTWIGPDYALVQIALTSPGWTGTISIDRLAFPPELPDATFQPQGADVLKLTASQFLNLLGRTGRQ
jgi:hypothetical protein